VRRALLGLLAAVIVIVGGGLLAMSGWIYAAFGADGMASAPLGPLDSDPSSVAVVIDVDSARVRIPLLPVYGTTTVLMTSTRDTALIAGSVDRESADAFLGLREIDAAYRDHGAWKLVHVPGNSTAAPWGELPTWLESGTSVSVAVDDGNTMIIGNADGSPGISVEASVQFAAPKAPQAALALGICGGVVSLAGIALAFSAIVLMRRRLDDLQS